MRIVLDAMGTDDYPAPDVAGAVQAARANRDCEIILVGREDVVQSELAKHDTAGLALRVVHAPEHIMMTDKPSAAAREKTESSMHIGLQLVKDGEAEAFVTAGNTGAAYAVSMLHTLKRISGVKRPALGVIFPFRGQRTIFLDVGANADAKAEWLAQFALMGEIYAQSSLDLARPRVGLLANGEEEGKGSQLVQEADALIRALPLNYIGNVEPVDIMQGDVDVVITDGFTGNILIKTFEASIRYFGDILRDELRADVFSSIGAALSRPAFNRVRGQLDTDAIGGGPLLGVNGVVIISHGSSSAFAIKSSIEQAMIAVNGGIIGSIERGVQDLIQRNKG